jgi:tRNA (guanine-N7-)-methyltransferase
MPQDHSPPNPIANVAFPKRIKTFVKRAGRTTTGQSNAIAQWSSQYVIEFQSKALDWKTVFETEQPVVFEIGFGMGDATASIAQTLPELNFLGCEVHEPGVGALLMHIHEMGLQNLRIISHDAVEVLEEMIPNHSLHGIHIFFPDPWHKLRHHKRRLIQTPFIESLLKKLKVGGYIHCATDWEPYAVQMRQVFSNFSQLNLQNSEDGLYSQRPSYRPSTKFEKRGLRLGHGVWDLVYQKNQD